MTRTRRQSRRQSDFEDASDQVEDPAEPSKTPSFTANDVASIMATLQQTQTSAIERLLDRVLQHETRRESSSPTLAAAPSPFAASTPAPHLGNFALCKARFSGATGDSLDNFIDAVESYKECACVSDDNALRGLSMLVTGDAAVWWQGLKSTITSWSAAVASLRSAFGDRRPPHRIYMELFSMSQGPGEKTEIFVAKARALLARLPPGDVSEKVQLDMLYELLHRRVRERLRRDEISSFETLLHKARHVEDATDENSINHHHHQQRYQTKSYSNTGEAPARNASSLQQQQFAPTTPRDTRGHNTSSAAASGPHSYSVRPSNNAGAPAARLPVRGAVTTPHQTDSDVTSSSSLNKNRFCVYCKRYGHLRDDCRVLKSKSENRDSTEIVPTCYGCNAKGVIRSQCAKCNADHYAVDIQSAVDVAWPSSTFDLSTGKVQESRVSSLRSTQRDNSCMSVTMPTLKTSSPSPTSSQVRKRKQRCDYRDHSFSPTQFKAAIHTLFNNKDFTKVEYVPTDFKASLPVRFFSTEFETEPLTRLTRKNQPWVWAKEQADAFEELKKRLTSAPILIQADYSQPFILRTDASNYALGAVLLQGEGVEERPIEYASRLLTSAEKNYSTTEREALAVVWAVERFRGYIDGHQVVVRSDHQPLKWLLTVKSPSGRLVRWALKLQSFNITYQYTPGKANVVADTLSRPPCTEDDSEECGVCSVIINLPSTNPADLRAAQLEDPDLQKIIQDLEDPDELTFSRWLERGYVLSHGVLYRYDEDSGPEEAQLVVPTSMRSDILKELHDSPTAGHQGIERTIQRLRERYYFPGMRRYVTDYLKQCVECLRYKPSNQKPAGLLQTPVLQQRGEVLAIDLFGPLPAGDQGERWILLVEDVATRWVELFALVDATAETCSRVLIEEYFLRYGLPRRVVSDNGTQFVSAVMQQCMHLMGVKQELIPLYHPEANTAERKNRDLKVQLSILVRTTHTDWPKHLAHVRFAMNSAVCSTTGKSPAFLTLARELRTPFDVHHDLRSILDKENFVPQVTPYLRTFIKSLSEIRERVEKTQDIRKEVADVTRQKEPKYNVGDLVLVRTHDLSNASKGVTRKFMPKRDGPYKIEQISSPTTFILADLSDNVIGKYHSTDLTPFTSPSKTTVPVRPKGRRGRPRRVLSPKLDSGRVPNLEGEYVARDSGPCSVAPSVISDEEADIEPSLSIMARSTVYNAGETKAIFCKGKNIVEPIEWFDIHNRKVATRSNKNTRVYVEKMTTEKDESLVPLIIHNAEVSDSGNWTCKAGDFSDYIDILVGEKVNITNRNVSMEGEEGKSIKFHCKAIGRPEPTVVWYKDNSPLPVDKDKYNILSNHTLVIKKLTHMDAGIYVCKVRQRVLSHYTDKTVHLSVQHKPILYNSHTQELYASKVYKTEEIYAILNETKNITCSAIANPPPTYRWFRRENSYDDDKNPIVDPETVITSEDGTSSVLVLRMHDTSYLGEYKCTASNFKGQEAIVFHVSLGTRPVPPDFVRLASANVTELTFNVSCSLCNMTAKDDVSPDPEHLTVLGYSFELVPFKKDFPPDWDAPEKFSEDVYITNPEDTLFVVGQLPNNTEYHVRVRTFNAAGYSDWFEISETAKTTNAAIRLAAALMIILATIVFTLGY